MKITIDVPQELVERHEALDSSATLNDSLIIALREYLEYWGGCSRRNGNRLRAPRQVRLRQRRPSPVIGNLS